MTQLVEVTTTLETAAQAQTLARQLVDKKLAGCVQLTGPIQSIFRWQGEVQSAEEYRCTLKSSAALLPEIIPTIETLHPYDVPEILVTEIIKCSPAYADWLVSQLKKLDT